MKFKLLFLISIFCFASSFARYHVVAIFKAQRDKHIQVQKALLEIQQCIINDGVCFMCNIVKNTTTPGLYFMYQIWENENDYKNHLKNKYIQNFLTNYDILFAEQPIAVTGTPILPL